MKLSSKQARCISYFLLWLMVVQSFTPYLAGRTTSKANLSGRITPRAESSGLLTPGIPGASLPSIPRLQTPSVLAGAIPAVSTTLHYSSDLTEGEIGLYNQRSFDNPQDNVFSIHLDRQPEAGQQVYLSYDLYGVSDKSGVTRSINDRASRGGYLVSLHNGWSHQREEIASNWLNAGENRIYFTVPQGATYGYKIKNLQIEVSTVPASSSPLQWESVSYQDGNTYVRGYFADQREGEVQLNGLSSPVYQGEFEAVLNGAVSQVELQSQGQTYAQVPRILSGSARYRFSTEEKLVRKTFDFSKKQAANQLNFQGVQLEVPGSQLVNDKKITVQNLRSVDLPALDMGLHNVTSQSRGYRFLPHGEHFRPGAVVKLAYDRSKLPSGYTEQDIRTYYFDLQTKHWVALERDSVDTKNQVIISRTTHFTDMINGVIQAPESPETSGFTPTTLSDIKVADPQSKVNQVSAPQSNNRGTASTGYSFEMPPARNGMSPSLGIQYNSDGGSGWLGEGWDLQVPGISVETRWGVPRYHNDQETETYLMDGSQLVTRGADGKPSLAHRGNKIAREADRYFYPRKEGSFATIQRKGSHPGNYTWEVTDRKGTKYTYGGNQGVVKGRFTDVSGQSREVISEWKLSRVEELHGDWIEYHYEPVSEAVRGGLTSQAVYLKEVRAGNKGSSAHTVVKFQRDQTKQKQTSSARYGYLTSQNQLLTQVEIYFEGQKLREYSFTYTPGAFYSDLLQKITHKDDQGKEFTSNTLTYHDPVKEKGALYGEPETWNTYDDGISADFVNAVSRSQQTGDFTDKATALGGSKSISQGGSIYVGVGWGGNITSKVNSGGASFGYSYSENKGLSTLVDINGDGIPDKIIKKNTGLYYRPGKRDGSFGEKIKIQGIDQFSSSYTNTTSFGASALVGAVNLVTITGMDKEISTTKVSRYFADVNGDGLLDLVVGNKVLFNHIHKDEQGNLIPTFTSSSTDTPSPIMGGGKIDDSDTAVSEEEKEEMIANNPLQDVVRVWVAPYSGMVKISGNARLLAPEGEVDKEVLAKADGVRLAVQHTGTELKSIVIGSTDYSLKNMAVASFAVQAGEKIYFRVQSGTDRASNGNFDQVDWSPQITYTDVTAQEDPNGYTLTYEAGKETLAYQSGVVMLPQVASYTVKGSFTKPVTSDKVTLKILLGDSEEVYRREFAAEEEYDGELEIPVANSQQAEQLQFIMDSPTYIAWETVEWKPVVHYQQKVDVSEGVSQQIEQSQPAGVRIATTYQVAVSPESPQTITHSGKGTLVLSLQQKPSLTAEQLTAIKGDFEVKVKDVSGTFHSGSLKVENGQITEGATQEIDLPQGKVWVELYSTNVSRKGLDHLKSVQASITDSLHVQTQSTAGVYRNWELQGYGPLHRQWGHFSYNAMNKRSQKPIEESLLQLPETEAEADPRKMVFIPLHTDIQTRSFWQGNDSQVYINKAVMSSSRLGIKDVILENPLTGLGKSDSTDSLCINGGTAIGVRQESKNESTSLLMSEGVLTRSKAEGRGQSLLAFMDMNGDGYPDIVSKGQVQLTNTRGGFDGEIVTKDRGYAGFQNTASRRISLGIGGSPVHAYSFISTAIKSLATKNKGSEKEKSESSSNSNSNSKSASLSFSVNASINKAEDETYDSFTDVNGDGLPDKILRNKQVRINLGYSFSEPIDWELDKIQEGSSQDVTLGLGYDIGKSSWSVGIGLAASKIKPEFMLIDINGDGLTDKVRVSGSTVYVSLNKGNSFAPEIEWNGLSRPNRSTSVSESQNGAFTYGFTLFGATKMVLNPSVNTGRSMNRILSDLKDVDGDGYLDIVSSDKENQLQVQRSLIGKSNKLKTVTNTLGGSFSVDYTRSEATYDHPGGKWVLSSVEINDGIHDDGSNTRMEYRYSKGKHDRHEREFLGFGKVESLSIDTENNNQVYRKHVQEYDVSNYYRAGNSLRSSVEDAQGKLYSESITRYYQYEVRQSGKNNYTLSNTDLCGDTQSSYTPVQYTRSTVYEGQNEGMVANESWYAYDTQDQYGELVRYRYSDSGSLGEQGKGSYNYETRIRYTSNPSKNIYGLPVQVQVYGSQGTLYREVQASYDTQYANHLTQVRQRLNEQGEESVTDIVYDKYGNITQKTLPGNQKGERLWYKYRYDREYNMYLERIDDAYGYTSELENYDYRYGVPLSTKDYNGYYMATTLDNLGRIRTITGPNEMELGLPYTIKFEYEPHAELAQDGSIQRPAYAITQHYDPQHQGNDIETISFVDGVGRALQVKKDGVLTQTDAQGSHPEDKKVLIVSGRSKLDPYGRVVESYYPVSEDPSQRLTFNRSFDAVTPTRTRYDILDRALETVLPDESVSRMNYGIDTSSRTLVTTVTDALGGKQSTYTNGSGLTLKTEQLSGPSGTISTSFSYDAINQLLTVTDTEGQQTRSEYDLAGRRIQVQHPSAGTTQLSYDALGNVISRQSSNLAASGKQIKYEYQYARLTKILYPEHPENNVTYHYGGKNAKENRVGRVVLQEDATGAQEFKYGRLGEVTEVRRTVIIPNQAIATYVTKTKYDSWNRIEQIIYPDEEKVEYKYNTAGQLVQVKGSKAYSYNYVEKIGYDQFEQRNYLKYCNGSETSYTYDPQRRRLSQLQVWTQSRSNSTTPRTQIMDNRYTYDAVSNVLSVANQAPLPGNGKNLQGGQMEHRYSYDGLYRLTGASGTYTGADQKTARYQLTMAYDNLHNITRKTQDVSQQNLAFQGGLNAGYDLVYNYNQSKKNQIEQLDDTNYRTEEKQEEEKREQKKAYQYDANGNLVYVNTRLKKQDQSESDKTNERKLLWDEENRLRALDDNGYVSNYWYDASGERVIKTSGESEQVYVNSLFAGGVTQTNRFSAYINPYMVVAAGGKYTKHYYIGSQRVVSKLGDLESFGADPRRIEYAGATLDGIKIDWKGKYQQSLQDIRSNYAHFEVPYNGKDNDDYVNGQGFCCSDDQSTSKQSSSKATAGTEPVNYEKLQYYYHADHLGSSSYITSLDGDIVQHVEYVPFGEVFVEERNNSWNTPYLFNGKELDEETGLYYYGARYYNPRESVFLSVDPLTEMTGTPYQYCYQNPVKYIDPTGMKADWHEDGNGNLVADKGDSAGTLAKKLNMSQKAAEEMLEKQGYKTYERDGKRYTQINQGSKVKWYCKLSDAPKSKSKSSGNAQGASSTSNTTSGSNVSTTTKSIVTERELIPNPLISVTSNVTKTYGNAGMFNTDSKVTNGINASQDYQFNLLDLIKSNTEVSSSSISMGVGISVFGLNDVSAGVKLDSNVLNSEINVGISEDINRDNTSTGSSIGVKPLGILVILGIMKSGNLAPLLNPQTILSY